MRVHLRATGTRPLLVHNVRLASPLDPIVKQIKQITSKKTKTDDDRLAIARLEFEGGLYHDPVIGPYLPGVYMLRCLQEGAKFTREGKKIERGVVMEDFMMPLIYKGPRTIEELWGDDGDSEFVDMRTVVVSRQKVDRCRPIFNQWVIETTLYADPEVLNFEDLERIAANAGKMEGLGDYRSMYGRFTAQLVNLDDAPSPAPTSTDDEPRSRRRTPTRG